MPWATYEDYESLASFPPIAFEILLENGTGCTILFIWLWRVEDPDAFEDNYVLAYEFEN